jgi:glycosyltransferase involved in cell wall biosynthesis
MTVWINNPFDFLPGEGARLQRYGLLAQALAQAGHRVIWWSSDWSHVEKKRREGRAVARPCSHLCQGFHLREYGYGGQDGGQGGGINEVEEGASDRSPVQIRLIKTMPYYQNVGLRRLLSHWLYAKEWKREALRCDPSDRPDLILCSAPPLSTGWVMRGLCKHFACKGVVDVMDLWPETFERVAPAWMLWPLRWMAKRVYQGADAISAVGDSYLEAVREVLKFETPRQGEAVPKPMYRCYHGIECRGERSLACAEGPLRLVYVGNMGRGYDLETLVRAVKELVKEGVSISLTLAGGGEQEPALKRLAHATQAITFQGVVRDEQLRALLEEADLGVVPMFPSTVVAVPYKLADYVAAGLPVVNSLRGETHALLEQYACGWQYEAGSVASLKQALREACELKLRDGAAFEARRNNARRLAEECFDAARIYPAFVAFLLPLSGSKGVIKSNTFQTAPGAMTRLKNEAFQAG